MGPILLSSSTRGTSAPTFTPHPPSNRITHWIEQHSLQTFALLSVAYATVVVMLSHYKLLWLDELITMHIAQLGSGQAIWNALAQAADPNPPLTHLAVLGSMRLFGTSELALRVPAMLGYWIGLAALFLFLRRHVPATWALAGVIFSMANASFDYSYESRSYAIFYGMAMLAVLCWSEAVDPSRSRIHRHIALAGMTLALAAGISTNYFAVLAFFPVAGGELARTLARSQGLRRNHRPVRGVIELRVWAAFAVAASPLLLFLQLIRRSIAQFAPHAWNKVSLDQVFDSYLQMVEVILFPVVALILLYALMTIAARRPQLMPRGSRWLVSLNRNRPSPPALTLTLHEGVAVFLLMSYPFLGYIVAKLHGGMLSPRFVIPMCLGFAITGTVIAYSLFGHLHSASVIALALISAVFIGRVIAVGHDYREQRKTFMQVLGDLPAAAGNRPIVVADPLMVLTLQHYAPRSVAS
ncbi:MAG TPA: glycosyltransferase family 39 protein, partial [Edaphobacter sp.]